MAYAQVSRNPYDAPVVAAAPESERASFLRKVAGLTFAGLFVSGTTSVVSASAIVLVGSTSHLVSLAVMMGSFFIARMVGGSLVYSESAPARYAGFFVGSVFQGVAMGYLILSAMFLSQAQFGNPLVFLVQAAGLVGLTVAGMVAYLLTGPKQLSMVGGALAAMSLPMLALMVISFIWPIGGFMGMLLSALFVVMSAGGLLYSLNNVMHQMSTQQYVAGAFHVTMGVLTLFWNVLTFLMRMQRR